MSTARKASQKSTKRNQPVSRRETRIGSTRKALSNLTNTYKSKKTYELDDVITDGKKNDWSFSKISGDEIFLYQTDSQQKICYRRNSANDVINDLFGPRIVEGLSQTLLANDPYYFNEEEEATHAQQQQQQQQQQQKQQRQRQKQQRQRQKQQQLLQKQQQQKQKQQEQQKQQRQQQKEQQQKQKQQQQQKQQKQQQQKLQQRLQIPKKSKMGSCYFCPFTKKF